MQSDNKLAMKIVLKSPLSKKAVRTARKLVSSLAEEWGFPHKACQEIELCFSEAIHNALEHGSPEEASVSVTLKLSDDGMRMDIKDRGAGAGDVDALKSAFKNKDETVPNLDNERGRGIFLIRSLMDRSKLKILKKGGVCITMVKGLRS